jgi:HD-GYP domain-containing protein (c-di-GMP phosphodiesterase class II)
MRDSIRIVHEHHEWYDGHGYPSRIKGEDIDLLARIVCVADSFDAMTSQRPYRKTAMTVPQAAAELKDKSGTQFDPEIVKVFVSLLEQGTFNHSS